MLDDYFDDYQIDLNFFILFLRFTKKTRVASIRDELFARQKYSVLFIRNKAC